MNVKKNRLLSIALYTLSALPFSANAAYECALACNWFLTPLQLCDDPDVSSGIKDDEYCIGISVCLSQPGSWPKIIMDCPEEGVAYKADFEAGEFSEWTSIDSAAVVALEVNNPLSGSYSLIAQLPPGGELQGEFKIPMEGEYQLSFLATKKSTLDTPLIGIGGKSGRFNTAVSIETCSGIKQFVDLGSLSSSSPGTLSGSFTLSENCTKEPIYVYISNDDVLSSSATLTIDNVLITPAE
ncbi:hypothetical protein P886_0766 [Alteromonadaceae bacterium 2753L.S.0a.02]|nr:hypothetical protein P886_0766 [Alteromonadaceae bacterium 2753L.S.0a.02]